MLSQAPIAEDAVLEMDDRKPKALDSEKQAAGEAAAGGGAAGEGASGSGKEHAGTSFDEHRQRLARRRDSETDGKDQVSSVSSSRVRSSRHHTALYGKGGMTLQLYSKQQLTEEYCAYTPLLLRKELPATRASARKHKIPRSHESLGTTLFLDISGFTTLGEKLRKKLGAAEGAAALADTINEALTSMVEFVYEFGGDVLKFAGDALICLFEGDDADETLLRAKTCSVKLLAFFAEAQKAKDTGLSQIQIHGGMAEGYLKCMHLGTEEVVPGNCMFMVAGRVLKIAGKMMDKAKRGEIYVIGMHTPITATTILPEIETVATVNTNPPTSALATAYVSQLATRRIDYTKSSGAAEMLLNETRKVAIIFINLKGLRDIDEISTDLDLINRVFVCLSTLTHRKNGAVRDMLFEDKGCTFISVFGALKYNEQTELRAVLCAMEMAEGLKKEGLADFTIGVSVGPCFCGVAGPHFRRDYVVIGPEVNLVSFR